MPKKKWRKRLRKFRDFLKGWDGDYHVDSTQASLFALWEMLYHTSFLADQIPQQIVRDSMVNIPDSDLFLMDILENLVQDKGYLSKYCQSTVTIYGKSYNLTENKCLTSPVSYTHLPKTPKPQNPSIRS